MKLREIAHSRTGDKGNIANISLIAYDMEHYPMLQEQVTAERVKAWFRELVQGEVVRYELPSIGALNRYGYIPRSLLRTNSCFAVDTPQLAAAQFIFLCSSMHSVVA